MNLPKIIQKNDVFQTPILIQGSKLQLIPFIFKHIQYNIDNYTYYEPFLGSGLVVFNLLPKKAILSDVNPHIIRFYKDIQDQLYSLREWKQYLKEWRNHLIDTNISTIKRGNRFLTNSEVYYYEKRNEFNEIPSSPLFLFLNLSCYHRLMRFNSHGKFNSPYMHQKAKGIASKKDINGSYITFTLQSIKYIQNYVLHNDVEFKCVDFKEILPLIGNKDFVYIDPPYYHRDTNYFDVFSEEDNTYLINYLNNSSFPFAYSNWNRDSNGKKNEFIYMMKDTQFYTFNHEYRIGTKKGENRTGIEECLLVSNMCKVTKKMGLSQWI